MFFIVRSLLIPLVVLLMLVSCLPLNADESIRGNTSIESFSKAKRILEREIYSDHRLTFYCGCGFDGKKITERNGYVPKKEWKRANRIEWEHIVPAHAFGQSFKAWREGDALCKSGKGRAFKGRNCARKVSKEFRLMESDMHNLVPAVGEINGLRSNYSFTMIPGEKRQFGSCDMEIEDRKAEPPLEVRGDIARVYMYMDKAYPGHGIISRKNRKLFEAWDREDPVDAWECKKQRRVAKWQRNRNPVVFDQCKAKGL